jgi:hypothetical protein
MHFPDIIIEETDMPFQDTRNYRVTSEKANKVFGFKSIHSIDEGIDGLKFLVETRRIKNLNSPRYSNQAYLKEMEGVEHGLRAVAS